MCVSCVHICVHVNVSYEYIFQDETESVRQVLRCCVYTLVHVMCVHVCIMYVSYVHICVYVNVSNEYIFHDPTESMRQVLRCCVCTWVHVMCMHVCFMCTHTCICKRTT